MNECGALLVWYWEGTTKVPIPVPCFPLVIPHGLTWDWIQASLMRGQQLTAEAKHDFAVNIKIITCDVQPCIPSLVVRHQATFRDTWSFHVLSCKCRQQIFLKCQYLLNQTIWFSIPKECNHKPAAVCQIIWTLSSIFFPFCTNKVHQPCSRNPKQTCYFYLFVSMC
jgi:hypothetical protein